MNKGKENSFSTTKDKLLCLRFYSVADYSPKQLHTEEQDHLICIYSGKFVGSLHIHFNSVQLHTVTAHSATHCEWLSVNWKRFHSDSGYFSEWYFAWCGDQSLICLSASFEGRKGRNTRRTG